MSDEIEERLSRVEATLQGIKRSIDLTNRRIDDLREGVNKRIDALRNDISENRAEIRDLRGRLWWIIGILFSMWVTIILAILLRE